MMHQFNRASAPVDREANCGGNSAPGHCAHSCCQSLVPLPTLGRLSMERNVIQPMPAAGAIRPAAAESAARAECGKTPEPIRIMMPMPVPYCRTAVAASMPTNHCIAKLSYGEKTSRVITPMSCQHSSLPRHCHFDVMPMPCQALPWGETLSADHPSRCDCGCRSEGENPPVSKCMSLPPASAMRPSTVAAAAIAITSTLAPILQHFCHNPGDFTRRSRAPHTASSPSRRCTPA